MDKFDAVVVGGGCAGAATGILLARAGRNTLIIDKAVFPRKKLCGGMITDKTMRLLREIYADSLDSVVDSRYQAFGVYHAFYGRISGYRSAQHTLYMVNRDVFDYFFLRKAEQAGCTLHLGDGVVKINNGILRTASGREIAADFIVGADGAHSIVRRALYPSKRKESFSLGLEVDIAYDNMKFFVPSEELLPWVFFGYRKGGYGWVFPKRDFVTVGIAGPATRVDKYLMDAFKRLLDTVSKDKSLVIQATKGHPVPLNNCYEKPGIGTVLLVGDAAHLVEPLTGEGIYFGALSGSFAARAILSRADHARTYNLLIEKHCAGLFRQARFANNLFYNNWIHGYAMKKMKGNAKWCKYFFHLLSGEIDYIGYFPEALRDRSVYPAV
jgi:geranylgeranyl reductase family protein